MWLYNIQPLNMSLSQYRTYHTTMSRFDIELDKVYKTQQMIRKTRKRIYRFIDNMPRHLDSLSQRKDLAKSHRQLSKLNKEEKLNTKIHCEIQDSIAEFKHLIRMTMVYASNDDSDSDINSESESEEESESEWNIVNIIISTMKMG